MSEESPPEADEIQLGAAGLVANPKLPVATYGGQSLREARRQAKRLMREAAELEDSKRKCKAKVKLRGPDGEYLRDAAGNVQTRPCKKAPIRGGHVCPTHGGSAPQVKKKAERRLNAMLEPAIVRMDYLMHQDEHLPTALAASLAVQNRVLGQVGKDDNSKDTRPIINIGIAVGGVPVPVADSSPGAKVIVATNMLPAAKVAADEDPEDEDDVIDGDVADA